LHGSIKHFYHRYIQEPVPFFRHSGARAELQQTEQHRTCRLRDPHAWPAWLRVRQQHHGVPCRAAASQACNPTWSRLLFSSREKGGSVLTSLDVEARDVAAPAIEVAVGAELHHGAREESRRRREEGRPGKPRHDETCRGTAVARRLGTGELHNVREREQRSERERGQDRRDESGRGQAQHEREATLRLLRSLGRGRGHGGELEAAEDGVEAEENGERDEGCHGGRMGERRRRERRLSMILFFI